MQSLRALSADRLRVAAKKNAGRRRGLSQPMQLNVQRQDYALQASLTGCATEHARLAFRSRGVPRHLVIGIAHDF